MSKKIVVDSAIATILSVGVFAATQAHPVRFTKSICNKTLT